MSAQVVVERSNLVGLGGHGGFSMNERMSGNPGCRVSSPSYEPVADFRTLLGSPERLPSPGR